MLGITPQSLQSLSIHTLRQSCYHNLRVPPGVMKNKGQLIEHIVAYHTPEQRSFLLNSLEHTSKREGASRNLQVEITSGLGQPDSAPSHSSSTSPNPSLHPFPCVPSDIEKLACMKRFWEATTDAATNRAVCAVCSREFRIAGESFTECRLSNIPHPEALFPPIPHPKHTLFEGMLLEPRGVFHTEDGHLHCRMCSQCRTQLSRPNLCGPMKYSLANNLWVGDDPSDLADLSLPEQLLISLAYPRVFQFNLYCAGQEGGSGPFQKGLRGTVTTHPLDLDGLVEVAKGNRLPRPLEVLPALIKITILGHNQLDKRRLIPLFTVRRSAILRALLWMKENNPKYYATIQIDRAALDKLPCNTDEGDVPQELLHWVRQNDNVHAVHQEEGGYVQSEGQDCLESDLSQVPSQRTLL